jgi:hypothetical protein
MQKQSSDAGSTSAPPASQTLRHGVEQTRFARVRCPQRQPRPNTSMQRRPVPSPLARLLPYAVVTCNSYSYRSCKSIVYISMRYDYEGHPTNHQLKANHDRASQERTRGPPGQARVKSNGHAVLRRLLPHPAPRSVPPLRASAGRASRPGSRHGRRANEHREMCRFGGRRRARARAAGVHDVVLLGRDHGDEGDVAQLRLPVPRDVPRRRCCGATAPTGRPRAAARLGRRWSPRRGHRDCRDHGTRARRLRSVQGHQRETVR